MSKITICIDTEENSVSTITQNNDNVIIKAGEIKIGGLNEDSKIEEFTNRLSSMEATVTQLANRLGKDDK